MLFKGKSMVSKPSFEREKDTRNKGIKEKSNIYQKEVFQQ